MAKHTDIFLIAGQRRNFRLPAVAPADPRNHGVIQLHQHIGGENHSSPTADFPSMGRRSSHAANIISMIGRPEPNEAAPYYFGYINRVSGNDVIKVLHSQLDESLALLRGMSEEKSLYRYAADKWSIRQMWNHVNDTERIFLLRALWFARGLESELPSFDQEVAVAAGNADDIPWARHIEEFREIRLATLSFFRNLPEEAWLRNGVASGNPFTVRACAYVVAGHVAHHAAILREKYF
ncbi:MAG TPA: DinB family protein [Candidatus Angelobacter sp.]